MVRKFGKLIAILLATGGVSLLVPIAVYADAPAPVSHAVTNDQHSETVITNSQTSSITTGTSDSNDDGVPSNTSQNSRVDVQTSKSSISGTEVDSDATTSRTTSIDHATLSGADSNNDSSSGTPAVTQTPAQQVAQQEAVTTSAHIASAMRTGASQALAGNGPASSAPAAAPVSQPASNHQLPPVQGALQGLNGALATFVVPQTAKLFGLFTASHDFRTTSTAPIQAALVIILTVLVGSFFLDSLRRSGYHGAARGDDVHSALLSFATPGKVDVIWATKPSYAATFLVSEIKAVTQRF